MYRIKIHLFTGGMIHGIAQFSDDFKIEDGCLVIGLRAFNISKDLDVTTTTFDDVSLTFEKQCLEERYKKFLIPLDSMEFMETEELDD